MLLLLLPVLLLVVVLVVVLVLVLVLGSAIGAAPVCGLDSTHAAAPRRPSCPGVLSLRRQ